MLSRDDVIGRLTTMTEIIAEDLADETNDDRFSLENVHRYLSTLLRRMKDDAATDAAAAKTIGSALGLVLDFEIATRNPRADKACETCGGCPAGPGCIGAYLLDDHKACTCPPKTAPVPAQTI
jgi:hypothetical protein